MTIENIHLCNVSSITQEKKNPFMQEFEVSLSPAGPVSGPPWGER